MTFSIPGQTHTQEKETATFRRIFVSRQNGRDSDGCGAEGDPCRTLTKAFNLTSFALHVYIDGTRTENDPYKCENVAIVLLYKPLILQGFNTTPHFSCKSGLSFNAITNQVYWVTLSRLVFINTPLVFKQHVVFLQDCVFHSVINTFTVRIYLERRQNATISLRETLFRNNSFCLYVFAKSNPRGSHLFIKIHNAQFTLNQWKAIEVASISRRRLQIDVECKNVTFCESMGAFLVLQNLQETLDAKIVTRAIVVDSVFRNNNASSYGLFWVCQKGNQSYCTFKVANTIFVSNGGYVVLCKVQYLNFTKVTMNNTRGAAVVVIPTYNALIIFKYCVFSLNWWNIRVRDYERIASWSSISLTVQDTVFYGYKIVRPSNWAAPRGIIVNLRKIQTFAAGIFIIVLDGVIFENLTSVAFAVDLGLNKVLTVVKVKNTLFRLITEVTYNGESTYGTLSFIVIPNAPQESHILFENTRFDRNIESRSIVSVNLNTSFKNCIFENNMVFGPGTILFYSQRALKIVNTTFVWSKKILDRFKSTGSFASISGHGELTILNSSFITDRHASLFNPPMLDIAEVGTLIVDQLTSVKCSVGSELHIAQKKTVHRLKSIKFYCRPCSPNDYSLSRGYSKGMIITKSSCQPCPYGATCLGNIKVKNNFGGYIASNDPLSLKFVPCPHKYCNRSRNISLSNYNGCYGNRNGMMCGQCASGYTEELFTTECREKKNCKDHWFWILTLGYIVVLALYLVFKPPIASHIYRQIFWFQNQVESNHANNYAHHTEGYIKIVFYFYQIAELLLLSNYPDIVSTVVFITPVVALLNFQMQFFTWFIGCLLKGLTVVTKEIFLSLKVPATIFCILPIYLIHRTICCVRRTRVPSVALYLAVALETLLLGYENMTETSLMLLHCVPMGSSWRLFYDGNIQCWKSWQIIFVAYIATFALPLIPVLYWGSSKLYKNGISAKEFLGACVLPLPFLLHWTVR